MEAVRLIDKPSLTLTREYAAPPERIWRAWTDAKALSEWWGPEPGGAVSVAELDVRVGGRFHIVFGGPDGKEHEVQGVYREVVPNRKLVFTWVWPRTTPERESVVTIVFEKVAGGTNLAFRHEHLFDEAVRDGHRQGWTETFAKLEQFLSS